MPAALLAWLQAGTYLGWRADPQRHQTLGPHGFEVRTFFNDAVVRSLEAGDAPHPAGSALVKELYSGDRVVNWAVMVKLQAESDRGNGWYWYEGVGLQGKGLSICTSCHIGPAYNGLTGRDFVFSPLPPP